MNHKIYMKKTLLLCISCLLLFACNQDKIDQLESNNAVLEEKTQNQDSILNEMLGAFNQIQENLNDIKKREGILELESSKELSENDIAGNIENDIALISELMKENEALIAKLNKQVSGSNIKMQEFRKLIENLNQQVADKNLAIAKLNDALKNKDLQIGELYFSIDSLNYANRVKEKTIEEKVDELNTAYYAYGTFDELKEKNVLSKEGGFLGIGKNETLKQDFNKDYFNKVDISKQKSFLIYAKKAELITNHPSNSYAFMGSEGKVDSLVIKDPAAFWSSSKYMVVVID